MKFVVFFVLALHFAPAFAGEYFAPAENPLFEKGITTQATRYEFMVKALRPAFGPNVRARLIQYLSSIPPYTVALQKNDDGNYEILYMRMTKFPDEIGHGADIPVESCRFQISEDLGFLLHKTWFAVLQKTSYDVQESKIGRRDGALFSAYVNAGYYGNLIGETWSPGKRSKARMLLDIGDALSKLCLTKNVDLIADIQSKSEYLLDIIPAQYRFPFLEPEQERSVRRQMKRTNCAKVKPSGLSYKAFGCSNLED